MYADLKVGAGIAAWFRSGPLYIPIWIFFWATPTTRKVDWLICTLRPTTSSDPKRSRASSSPRKTTRRFSAMSRSFRNRPPAWGCMLRISPNSGLTPRTRVLIVFGPTVMGVHLENSTLSAAISGMRLRRRSGSSSLSGIGRPEGRPIQAFVVAPGQTTPMPSPIPRVPLAIDRLRPSPKERRRTIESVPQAMARTVRTILFVWWPRSARKSRSTRANSAAANLMRA